MSESQLKDFKVRFYENITNLKMLISRSYFLRVLILKILWYLSKNMYEIVVDR